MKPPSPAGSAFYICGLIALFAILTVGVARANVISYSTTTGLLPTDWSAPLSFSQFDPALGTLTQVQVSLDSSSFVDVAAENLAAMPGSVAFNDAVGVTVDGLGLTPLFTLSLVAVGQQNFGPFDGTVDFAGTSGFTWPTIQTDGSLSDTWTSGFGAFSGLSVLGFLASSTATNTLSGSAGVISSLDTDSCATLTVVYTYTPANVPDSLSTVGALTVAVGLLGLLRRWLTQAV